MSNGIVQVNENEIVIKELKINDVVSVEYFKQIPPEMRATQLETALKIGIRALNQSENLNLLHQVSSAKSNLIEELENQKKIMVECLQNLSQDIVSSLRNDMRIYLGTKSDKGHILRTFENIEKTMNSKVQTLVNETVQKFDPDASGNNIPQKLTNTINDAWKKQLDAFKNLLSKENPENPIAAFIDNQEAFQSYVENMITEFRKEIIEYLNGLHEKLGGTQERKGTTKGGFDFQDSILLDLRELSSFDGSMIDDVSVKEGFMKSKMGDQLVRVTTDKDIDISFSIETKTKLQNSKREESRIISILEEVKKNRGVQVAMLVVQDSDAIPAGVGPIKIYGNDKIIVVYNEENRETLKIGYRVATLLARLHAKKVSKNNEKLSLEAIQEVVGKVKSNLNQLKPVMTSLDTIIQQAEKAKQQLVQHKANVLEALDEIENKI